MRIVAAIRTAAFGYSPASERLAAEASSYDHPVVVELEEPAAFEVASKLAGQGLWWAVGLEADQVEDCL